MNTIEQLSVNLFDKMFDRDFEIKYNGMVTKIKEYADPQYYIDISVLPA